MYRGAYQRGTEIPLGIMIVDSALAPQAPAAAPAMDIYKDGTLVVRNKKLPAIERHKLTGLFGLRIFLDSKYTAGRYTAVYRWLIGAAAYMDADSFEVLPSGDPDGTPIASYLYRCPHADYIVQQLDSGKLVAKRNPSLT